MSAEREEEAQARSGARERWNHGWKLDEKMQTNLVGVRCYWVLVLVELVHCVHICKTWLIRGDDARRRVEKRLESCGRCRRGPLGRWADIPNRDEARQLVLGLLHPARHGRAP